MIPLTIIGGYLGAGKTTLLNQLLAGDHGLRLAVLVNDFGEVNIDASLITSHDGDTYTLANGCICCSIGDDLSGTLMDIARAENPPDEVIIEASGVADATRFATYSGEWIGFGLRAVVVLADVETIRTKATDKYVGDLVVQQLRGADLVILNKTDLVSPATVDEVRVWLETKDISAPTIATTQGELRADVLFDMPAEFGGRSRAHDEQAVDHTSLFSSTVIRSDESWNRASFEAALGALPTSIVRAKGFIVLDGEAMLLQLVGERWKLTETPNTASKSTEIVLLGTADQAAIDAVAGELAAMARR